MKRFFLLIFIFPVFLFSDTNEEFSEKFSIKLFAHDVQGCNEVLYEWEQNDSATGGTIMALRASVALLEGDLLSSSELINEALIELENSSLSPDVVMVIKKLYKNAWEVHFIENEPVSLNNINLPPIILCKHKASPGTKLKYWFGVAQIVAACVVAPFNPPAAAGLAISGINTTISAAGDAIDSKEDFERNLNERQRMVPENTALRRFSIMPFKGIAV